MTLMIIVLLAGMQVLLFGFIGSLLVILRREIFRVQRRQGEMLQRLDKFDVATKTEPVEPEKDREKNDVPY
jgi:hypothetical protein